MWLISYYENPKMTYKRSLLKYILVYAALVLAGSLAYFICFTLATHSAQPNTTTLPISWLLLAGLSMVYWSVAWRSYNKPQADAQADLERLKLALIAANQGLWDWDLTKQYDIFFSSTYCDNLGYSQAEFGSSLQDWKNRLLPEERELLLSNVMHFIHQGDGNYDSTYRMQHKNGSYRWIRSRGSLVKDSAGKPIRFIGIAHDITAQRGAEERLKQAQAVFESTHEGVVITDRTNTIVHINPAFSNITGYSDEDVLGKTPSMFSSGRHTPEFYQALWASLEANDQWSGEIWNRRKNGEILPQYQTIRIIRDENGLVSHNVAVFSDLSLLKDSQSELNYLAHYDLLTGLANRTQLYERLNITLQTLTNEGKNGSAFLIDLDHFKSINESLGHSVGDQVLQAIAERINAILDQRHCTLSRIGGDEFVVICQDSGTPAEAALVAQALIKASKEPFIIDNKELFISASVGICLFPHSAKSVEDIMRNADSALSKAKASGRDTFAFYSSEMTEQAFQRISIGSELRAALETQGLMLYYQPVYAMGGLTLVGCEALVRWNHPERGLVSPGEFIPIAEEIGLISAIDEWVLQRACEQMHQWQKQGIQLDFVAVNLSSRSLSKTELATTVADTLKRSGVKPQYLELEVTESAVMEDPDRADATLKELRTLGVRLAIDDFGTGYSSLSRLKSLPVHKLKIDQSFIRNLPCDSEDSAIVRAILMLGKSIGLEVQAEGIETAEQMHFLQELDCPLGQGYWFGRPMPEHDFSKLINSDVQ